MRHYRILVPVLLGTLALAACGSRQDPQDLAQARADSLAALEAQRRAEEEARRRAEEEEARRRAAEEAAARRAEEEAAAEAAARARAIIEESVHFDFDRHDIRADAEESLLGKIAVLRANPTLELRIGGHADERGSVEYNLALGMRRATAVKEFLTAYGLEAERFETVSYGEERPIAVGHDEASWAQNRRAEFQITAGGGDLVAPPVSSP